MSTKIQIKGKTYDLEDPNDLAKVQALLVPANWPGSKKDGVRLFQTVSTMLTAQLLRHLAFNWKQITKIAQEEASEGNRAAVPIAFGFEIDQTAPSVAAIAGIKMSYSAKFSTKGKPQTHDLNQGDLFESSGPINLDDEQEPEPEEEKKDEEGGDKAPAEGKKPRGKKNKSTPKAESDN